MTTGISPYVTPDPMDTDAASTVLETTFIASHAMVDIGGGIMAHAETINGAIPGPTLRLKVNDTVIVRLINELDHPTGIHWHGIELANSSDGTEVTQEGVVPAFPAAPPAPPGGTYLYKFKVPRPGLFWYHPHHHISTNRVFRGMYGMIVVTDPNEATLIGNNVIPDSGNTRQIVLSDITVCKAPASNDAATYVDPMSLPAADRAEWLSGGTFQPAPTPVTLCEISPSGSATMDDHMGSPAAASYMAGEVPSMIRTGRINEGQTVLTNGMNVGGRLGQPSAPGTLAGGSFKLDVLSGQGLRLQIANCSTIRYFRLRLTTNAGAQVDLLRIGGEGGLLDNAILEGGVVGGFDTKYSSGEILLPPGSRADVVAAIPNGASGVLTLWTRDFQRNGALYSALPTVPVMHLNVTGPAMSTFTIPAGTPLRAAIMGAAVGTLGAATGVLLDPATFMPAKPGLSNQDIQITNPPGIDGVAGMFEGFVPYTTAPHIATSRYSEPGKILELTVTNQSGAHHPFHLHGFSFQPISLTLMGSPTYTWPYKEFRDNLDIPASYTLTFRVRLDDRPLKDGMTLGGALGRWLFHCHIFMHHHQGMISELVVSAADGKERPYVDVAGSWAYTPLSGTATRHGTFFHPDGDGVMLTASVGNVVPGAGTWTWSLDTMGLVAQTQYVYITATDGAGRKDQAVFRLKIGAPDDGADNGDPHLHTVDGTNYDFQAVGEFTLLRDREGMEIQVRQWPVQAATPITDAYSGLTSCVSVNTAVALRVGSHKIAYQPGRDGGALQFYLDGKRTALPREGLDLGADRVTAVPVSGGPASLRIDYAHGPVVIITPYFWSSYNLWLLNVSVSHTQAEEGLMGKIPSNSWLPALSNGSTVGPKPNSLHARYVALYRTFADAWRVTDTTSLFVYAPGTSTKTFTDRDWPAEKPPCTLKPQFRIPGARKKPLKISGERARKLCEGVILDDLHRDCVLDVRATGDKELAKMYELQQKARLHSCAVQIVADKPATRRGETLVVTATVLPLRRCKSRPKGSIVFHIDGKPLRPPVTIDERGKAILKVKGLRPGIHRIRAAYSGSSEPRFGACSSPNLLHTVGSPRVAQHPRPPYKPKPPHKH